MNIDLSETFKFIVFILKIYDVLFLQISKKQTKDISSSIFFKLKINYILSYK